MGTRKRGLLATTLAFSLLAAALPLASPRPVAAVSPDIVISQVYGGGGNSGATYTHDFIELYNRGTTSVSVSGWSVQYASATGTGNFTATALSGSVAPGQYYLVQQAAGTGGTTPLPAPDATGSIAMSATAGKVIVARTASSLACNGGSTPCSTAQLAQIADLVGYGNANFFEAQPAPTLSNTTAAIRAGGGATDTDNNAEDFAAGAPNPRNSGLSLSIDDVSADEGDSGTTTFEFTVTLSSPAPAGGVTFDIATADDTATTADGDYVAKSLASQTIAAGNSSYAFTVAVNGDAVEEADETFFVNVTNVSGATVADGQGLGTIVDDDADACAQPYTHIYDIQGSDMSAAITGNVTTQGVVVGDFEGPISVGLQGFYLQDVDGDDDATTYDGTTTSDGIFVFTGNNDNELNVGDVVRVTGFARERFNMTALNGANNNDSAVTNIVSCGTATPPEPVDVEMPFPSTTYLERFEGMLVRFPQSLVISEYFNYDRFGELVIGLPLPGESRHFTPTLLEEPGPDATARFNQYLLRRITLDDGLGVQNMPFTRHPDGSEFTLENRFRGGDTLANTVGVLSFDFSLYRIQPTAGADYTAVNHRPAGPQDVGGRLKVAVMNTLNFYITADYPTGNPLDNKCGPLNNQECRGWDFDQPTEFDRQRDKLLAALAGMDADVIGLNELENSTGVDPLADAQGIVPGLNAMFGAGTYASISTGTIGGDAIKVGLIYRPAAVTPVGSHQILTSAVDPRFDENRSRPALAQTFRENATGEVFTVVVNHLKSKGSGCGAGDDDPSPGGAGSCNLTRTLAAQALVDWLATDPTGSGDPDFLIMGDLNAYAMEDPIDAIRAGADDTFGTADDYTNLIDKYLGSHAYSFVFDGMAGYLDHALSNPTMTAQVSGATEWHINADEPDLLDYDTSFKSDEQDALYESNAYRSSDHDPLIVGLNLAPNVGKVTGGGRFAGGSLDVSVTFTTPTSGAGSTVVALSDGSTFGATAFEWFVLTGSTATYAGTGTLDGDPGYGFLVSVFDSGKPKAGSDRVRIRIWDGDGEAVYDSQPGAALTAPPTSPVTGNLVIHKVQ